MRSNDKGYLSYKLRAVHLRESRVCFGKKTNLCVDKSVESILLQTSKSIITRSVLFNLQILKWKLKKQIKWAFLNRDRIWCKMWMRCQQFCHPPFITVCMYPTLWSEWGMKAQPSRSSFLWNVLGRGSSSIPDSSCDSYSNKWGWMCTCCIVASLLLPLSLGKSCKVSCLGINRDRQTRQWLPDQHLIDFKEAS